RATSSPTFPSAIRASTAPTPESTYEPVADHLAAAVVAQSDRTGAGPVARRARGPRRHGRGGGPAPAGPLAGAACRRCRVVQRLRTGTACPRQRLPRPGTARAEIRGLAPPCRRAAGHRPAL